MAKHALPNMSFWKFTQVVEALFERNRSPKPQLIDAREDSRSRREFILQMLDQSADAFQSELDIQHMTRLYRAKF